MNPKDVGEAGSPAIPERALVIGRAGFELGIFADPSVELVSDVAAKEKRPSYEAGAPL